MDTSKKRLHVYVDQVDLEIEKEFRLNFERLQKTERLKVEATDLENCEIKIEA